jgi:hypothetical protein
MAKRVDPGGDKDPKVQAARKVAEDALKFRVPDK